MSFLKKTEHRDFNNLTVTNYDIFGWKMHCNTLPKGAKIVVNFAKDLPHNKIDYVNFYTKGTAIAVHENKAVPSLTRQAGEFSLDRTGIQYKGVLTTTAITDTEIWCINYYVNNKQLPTITPIVLQSNEVYEFKKSDLVFLCRGSFNDFVGPCTFVPDTNTTIVAKETCYIWILDRVGPF